jgi:hypothetical protein
MAEQIDELLSFATDQLAELEPRPNKKALGWVGGADAERPPAELLNWIHRLTSENMAWFERQIHYEHFRHWAYLQLSQTDTLVFHGVGENGTTIIAVGYNSTMGNAAVWYGYLLGDLWTDGSGSLPAAASGTTLRAVAGISNVLVMGEKAAGVQAFFFTAGWTDETAHFSSSAGDKVNDLIFSSANRYVAVGNNDILRSSADPTASWGDVATTSSGVEWVSIEEDGVGNVLVVGDSGSDLARSDDGGATFVAWAGPAGPPSSWQKVVYDSDLDRFILFGWTGTQTDIYEAVPGVSYTYKGALDYYVYDAVVDPDGKIVVLHDGYFSIGNTTLGWKTVPIEHLDIPYKKLWVTQTPTTERKRRWLALGAARGYTFSTAAGLAETAGDYL